MSGDVSCDVAGDVVADRADVLTWRVSPTRFCRSRAKMERGARTARWCALVRVGSLDVGACGRAGMQGVGSSPEFQQWIRPVVLYTMVCSKTRLENFDF